MTRDNQGDERNGAGGGSSRLTKHLEILGLGSGELPEPELAGERRLMEELTPRRLRFPAASIRQPARRPAFQGWRSWAAGGLLAAAAAVFFVLRPGGAAPPAWQVKGGGSVQVAIEENGAVRSWSATTPLSAGAKVKAEVAAAGPMVAFWGVASGDHRLLSERSWIWAERMALKAGDQRSFAGSLQLDGANEGETLVVVLCPEAVGHGDEAAVSGAVGDVIASGVETTTGPMAGCMVRAFKLR